MMRLNRKLPTIVTVFAGLLLAACASTPPIGSSGGTGITLTDATELPPPVGVDPVTGFAPYRIGANDQLLIDVFGFEELNAREITTDASGRISVPIAGEVNAMGMTLSELQQTLVQRLRAAYVRNPQVSVNINEVRSAYVTVEGEVEMPGVYAVTPTTTLIEAVARARSTTEFARLREVVIFRTVGDQRMVALYDLQSVRRGNYADPRIYAGDTIVVGESSSRRLFTSIVQTGTVLVGPLVAILQTL
jgi:polysaccharide biosynthesis/export protein